MGAKFTYLTVAGLKVLADHLPYGRGGDLPRQINDALMAALRNDLGEPFSVRTRNDEPPRDIPIPGRVTWVAGSCGAGKTETIDSFLREGIRAGYRAICYRMRDRSPHTWHRIDEIEVPLGLEALSSADPDLSLKKQEICDGIQQRPNRLFVEAYPLMRARNGFEASFRAFVDAIKETRPRDAIIAIEDADLVFRAFKEDIRSELEEAVAGQNTRFIYESQTSYSLQPVHMGLGASVLQGKSCDSPDLKGVTLEGLQSLREGEFFMLSGDEWLPVSGRYDGPGALPVHPADHREFALALEAGYIAGRTDFPSVTARRDFVARCAGFIDWEEAEKIIGAREILSSLKSFFKGQ